MSTPAHLKARRRLAVLFSIPLVFSLVFFFVDIAAERTDIGLVEIHNLSSSVVQLRWLARDAEAGERDFLLTGEDRFLGPFRQARDVLPMDVDACERAAERTPEFRPQVQRLVTLVNRRFEEADEQLEAQRTRGIDAAVNMLNSGDADITMNEIRRVANDLIRAIDHEEFVNVTREASLNKLTFVFFAVSTLIMIVLLVWLYNALISHLTERDAAHADLQRLNAELESRIAERTGDLTRANAELQQFAYVASHDLQEPLRTITSFSQLLEARYRNKLDEDADEFIGYIVTASRRMTDLINGLLALARLRKTGQQVAPVSFEKLVEQAEASLQAAIRENGARVEHGPLPSLAVDGVQISQVIQNLISNAIKYRRAEPPVIQIDAHRSDTTWTFSVRDNGRGFKPEFAERIFGLFQRLDSRGVDGTGMGLSIARKIVERHGGRIWAESQEGVGSTFYFSLPTSLETVHAEEPPRAARTASMG